MSTTTPPGHDLDPLINALQVITVLTFVVLLLTVVFVVCFDIYAGVARCNRSVAAEVEAAELAKATENSVCSCCSCP